ncbi:hypothetical protein Cob_v003355 [Colletotrichum orbiculare MAFF 240422]|uniref:Fungal N-terminal domain-containing protein n=1 Tax=Colletotrichum orbiculare (strain 104-T / ATCC 96160 / CBS 514.97 / LARS 414 / MAFF 240422) TaxID=1213857 RepID=A0A484G112_COLOR|nr:hypothetical protein Cob_v003355 [Colletotrichum orbiculare MAFF 240422]
MAAEGLGLAASVAGLVSLGLQITGGIVKYVDAFKGRKEELDFVRRQNDALAANLRSFQGWAPSPGRSPDIDAAVAHNIQLLESELMGVKALHDKLADNAGQSWAAKFENTKKRSTYPFNQAKVHELGQRLEKAMDVLLLAMNIMGLRTLRQQADTMIPMDATLSNFSSQTALIRSDMTAMTTPIAAINDQLQSLHTYFHMVLPFSLMTSEEIHRS